jgi:cytidine deaminase
MKMEQLINQLIDKRLGIHNNNINESMLGGEYYHIACVIECNKSRIIPLSYGMNEIASIPIHAECNAIRHLRSRRKGLKRKKINLVVIRTSKSKKITISKPCVNCMHYLNNKPQLKGYEINNIYYSDICGEIIKSSMYDLNLNTTHVSKYYRRLNKCCN